MPYKSRYLIDEGSGNTSGSSTLGDEEGNTDLTLTYSSLGVNWERENSTTYSDGGANGPYKKGDTGNPTGDDWSVNIFDSGTNVKYSGTPTQWSDDFTIAFWFRPNQGSFTQPAVVDNQLLFSSSDTVNATDSLHIVALQSGSTDIDSIKAFRGNGTGIGNSVQATSVLASTSELYWYFVCVTYDGSNLTIYTGNNNSGTGTGTYPSLNSTSDSFSSVTFSKYILAYDGLSESNQFKGSYSVLRIFDEVLSTGQIENLYRTNALDGSTYGDVHVIPWFGNPYSFHIPGFYRYFDDGNGFVINVETKLCKYARWNDNDYVTKIFIKTNNGYLICNGGFRGEKIRVIKSSGLKYELNNIKCDKNAYAYCTQCRYKTKDNKRRLRHRDETNHLIHRIMRNRISLDIETNDNKYYVTVTNVNRFNLQPCTMDLQIENKQNIQNYKGYFIEEKYSKHQLNSIDDISKI